MSRCSFHKIEHPVEKFSRLADGRPRYWCKEAERERARAYHHNAAGRQIHVRLEWEDALELERMAQRAEMSMNELVREMVKRHIEVRRRVEERRVM